MENKNIEEETYMTKSEEKVTIGIMIIEIFVGLLALLTIFLPALVSASDSYEGVFTTFGGGSNGGIVEKFFDFSFGNFLAYLFVVAAMILAFVRLALPKTDFLITKIVTGGLLLLGGLLLILCKPMTNMHVNVSKNLFKLGVGPLLGMIACIIDAIVVGIDIWFSFRIGTIKEDEVIKPLSEEELRAQVMAEIEAEAKAKEENKTDNNEATE